MRTALFWVITQRAVVISHRRFGTTYRYHFQESRSWLFRNDSKDYHYSLSNNPEESSSILFLPHFKLIIIIIISIIIITQFPCPALQQAEFTQSF
jgi:hypothetical protein